MNVRPWIPIVPSLLALLLVLAPTLTAAADKPRRVKYVPPEGFAGRHWGDLRSSFGRLPAEPLGVGAAYILPHEKASTFTCVVSTEGGCDFQKTLDRIYREYEGGGFYVLSEYAIPDQGFRMGGEKDGVVLHPVVYQFCANWHASIRKKTPPPNFDDVNQFCGMRLEFQVETREELAKLPADHVTVYDRMLQQLVKRFGEPAGYVRRGKVLIETRDGESESAFGRKFSIYRWCPAGGDGFHTDCKASVVLSIDPTTGQGTVLYSAPTLWEFANARETNGYKGEKLYKMLHARK
jgi:hypothetical protein